MSVRVLALLLVAGSFPILGTSSTEGETFEALCTALPDGDTLTVSRGDEAFPVRVYGIDCPESEQPYGEDARMATLELVFARSITVEVVDRDQHGRIVGRVLVEGADLALDLLRGGHAWHYRAYSDEPKYAAAEEEARAAKRGLWAQPDPVPPWVFRGEKDLPKDPTPQRQATLSDFAKGAELKKDKDGKAVIQGLRVTEYRPTVEDSPSGQQAGEAQGEEGQDARRSGEGQEDYPQSVKAYVSRFWTEGLDLHILFRVAAYCPKDKASCRGTITYRAEFQDRIGRKTEGGQTDFDAQQGATEFDTEVCHSFGVEGRVLRVWVERVTIN